MHIIIIYIGILFGIFLEGEMIMLSSVIAAHHGYLNIWIVLPLGIIGTYCADCFYFIMGRKKGKAWLNKKASLNNKIAIIDKKLIKYPVLIFLIYRFMYGLRAITPTVIGASKTKTSTFLVYSAMSVLLWALVYTAIGYMFGEIIKSELSYIEHVEKYIIALFIVTGLLLFLLYRLRKYKKNML